MTLADLVGWHELSGVDAGVLKGSGYGNDANRFFFVLDGATYMVTEDPDDGYRSHMRDIERLCDAPVIANRFEPVRLYCCHIHDSSTDVLAMLTAEGADAETVVEVGTRNTDDYYPYFVARFDPTKVSVVQQAAAGVVGAVQIARPHRPDLPNVRRGMRLGVADGEP